MPDPEGLRVKRGVQGRTDLARGERLASDGEGRSLPEWPARPAMEQGLPCLTSPVVPSRAPATSPLCR